MTLSNRRIPLIAGAAAVFLVVVWYLLLWGPETKKLAAAHKAHAAAVQQVGQLDDQVGQLNGLVKQIPADTSRLAKDEAALPDNPHLDQALNLLHQAAVASGVNLTSVAPTAPPVSSTGSAAQSGGPSAAGGPAITLNLSVQGGVGQITAFLSALSNLPRTVVVDKFSLSNGSPGSASITARIFYSGQPTP